MLGVAQEMHIRFAPRVERYPSHLRETLERTPGSFLAEIACDRGNQFFHGDRRAPSPEARHDRYAVRFNEDIRLQAFDRRRGREKRNADESENVEAETPQDAVGEGGGFESEQCLWPEFDDPEQTGIEDRAIQESG